MLLTFSNLKHICLYVLLTCYKTKVLSFPPEWVMQHLRGGQDDFRAEVLSCGIETYISNLFQFDSFINIPNNTLIYLYPPHTHTFPVYSLQTLSFWIFSFSMKKVSFWLKSPQWMLWKRTMSWYSDLALMKKWGSRLAQDGQTIPSRRQTTNVRTISSNKSIRVVYNQCYSIIPLLLGYYFIITLWLLN